MCSIRNLLGLCVMLHAANTDNLYKTERSKILQYEASMMVGGDIILTDKEADVNNCLMRHKFKEIDYAFDNPEYFNFSKPFFKYKDLIKRSKVRKIIKDMPKGATLHVHDMALMPPDYLLNLTYMDYLYVCFDGDDIQMRFSATMPNITCSGSWQTMQNARHLSGNVKKFDADLRKHFSMVVDDPDKAYPTIKETWTRFLKYFGTVFNLISYRPIWESYFYDALERFRKDNIMYVEVRSILPALYELDGTVYSPTVTAKSYQKSIKRFVADHPDFIGAKLIYAPPRHVNRTQLDEYLETAKRIKKEVPEIFAGFDLVGPEDNGNPLIEFAAQLRAASSELNYFFHAGETDWFGTSTDNNLVDAVLLGAKRLGHAYALPKHPLVLDVVKKKGIGLEVNVISNEVLSLVRDLRNHPLAYFLANGLPVVLSSDDPGAWEAEPSSDDFYIAFVAIANRLSDLKLLKALSLNSLKYSALSDSDKVSAIKKFNLQWNKFIDDFRCSNY